MTVQQPGHSDCSKEKEEIKRKKKIKERKKQMKQKGCTTLRRRGGQYAANTPHKGGVVLGSIQFDAAIASDRSLLR
jgi:hypothetical protein